MKTNDLPPKQNVSKIDKPILKVGEKAGDLKEGKETTVIEGKAQEKSQSEVFAEIAKTSKDKATLDALAPVGSDPSKAKYRERLYMVQDIMSKRALAYTQQVQTAKTTQERDRLLKEIRDIGAFCHALEMELRHIRLN